MIKEYHYMVDMFGEPMWLCLGTPSEMAEWLKDRFDVDVPEPTKKGGSHMCLEGEDGSFVNVIWMPSFDISDVLDLSTLLHEVLHYCVETLHNHNVPLATETDNGKDINSEMLAYFVAQVYRMLLKQVSDEGKTEVSHDNYGGGAVTAIPCTLTGAGIDGAGVEIHPAPVSRIHSKRGKDGRFIK